jgi:hypothetical protein
MPTYRKVADPSYFDVAERLELASPGVAFADLAWLSARLEHAWAVFAPTLPANACANVRVTVR